MARTGRNLHLRAIAASGIAMMSSGWDAGLFGAITRTNYFQQAFDTPGINLTSLLTATFLLASLAGSISTSYFTNKRTDHRQLIYIGNFIIAFGLILFGFGLPTKMASLIIIGRAIIGFGNGIAITTLPTYVAEMTVHKHHRGRGVSALVSFTTLGTALAYWFDFGLSFTTSSHLWIIPVATPAIFPILSNIIMYSLPNSPRFHYLRREFDRGDAVLFILADTENPREAVFADSKNEILASLELQRLEGGGELTLWQLFACLVWDTSDNQFGRRVRLAVVVFVLTQLQGTDFLIYYFRNIFQEQMNWNSLHSIIFTASASTLLLLTNLVSLFFIEHLGRKRWLLLGSFISILVLSYFCFAMQLSQKPRFDIVGAFLLYVAMLGVSWSPISYVYVSEIIPLRYRHAGFSLAISFRWLFGFLMVYVGPIAAVNIGWKIMVGFLAMNFASFAFVYFCCPETRGMTLEEIDLVFFQGRQSHPGAPAVKILEDTMNACMRRATRIGGSHELRRWHGQP